MKRLSIVVLSTVLTLASALAADDCDYRLTPMSKDEFQQIDDVMKGVNKLALQVGIGGNPDVDGGKPYREKSWDVAILYPVHVTRVGKAPVTIYAELKCSSLGKQPESAHTDNINVRCGGGVLEDFKVTNWLSAYARLDIVTSRFSHNGAPAGQINPKTGVEYRLYPNDTGFTGIGSGAGVKIKVFSNLSFFAEYNKYLVQQTDNVKYQFRGGYNFGIAKNFFIFKKKSQD